MTTMKYTSNQCTQLQEPPVVQEFTLHACERIPFLTEYTPELYHISTCYHDEKLFSFLYTDPDCLTPAFFDGDTIMELKVTDYYDDCKHYPDHYQRNTWDGLCKLGKFLFFFGIVKWENDSNPN